MEELQSCLKLYTLLWYPWVICNKSLKDWIVSDTVFTWCVLGMAKLNHIWRAVPLHEERWRQFSVRKVDAKQEARTGATKFQIFCHDKQPPIEPAQILRVSPSSGTTRCRTTLTWSDSHLHWIIWMMVDTKVLEIRKNYLHTFRTGILWRHIHNLQESRYTWLNYSVVREQA